MPGSGWRKSKYSGQDGDCLEAGNGPGLVLVRDTQDRKGPALAFTTAGWLAFTASLKGR